MAGCERTSYSDTMWGWRSFCWFRTSFSVKALLPTCKAGNACKGCAGPGPPSPVHVPARVVLKAALKIDGTALYLAAWSELERHMALGHHIFRKGDTPKRTALDRGDLERDKRGRRKRSQPVQSPLKLAADGMD